MEEERVSQLLRACIRPVAAGRDLFFFPAPICHPSEGDVTERERERLAVVHSVPLLSAPFWFNWRSAENVTAGKTQGAGPLASVLDLWQALVPIYVQ